MIIIAKMVFVVGIIATIFGVVGVISRIIHYYRKPSFLNEKGFVLYKEAVMDEIFKWTACTVVYAALSTIIGLLLRKG